jgi:hypothetical protein
VSFDVPIPLFGSYQTNSRFNDDDKPNHLQRDQATTLQNQEFTSGVRRTA